MATNCAVCGAQFGGDRLDERECEQCHRGVCFEHFVGGYRICSECNAAADAAEELVYRKARALDAIARGIPTPVRHHDLDRWFVPLPSAGSELGGDDARRLVAWLRATQSDGWPSIEDAVLAAADAVDGKEG